MGLDERLQEETRVSKEILARVAEAYRKIRNTLRYLLSNLYDFDPARDAVERTHMEEVDRYILARYGDLARKILSAYEAYDYSTIFQAVNAFITVDLSAFYADVSKDRLYTFAAGSKERRSAQTAMFVMTDGCAPARADPVVLDGRTVAVSSWETRRVGAPCALPSCGRDRALGRSQSARYMGTPAAYQDYGQRITGIAEKRQADRHVPGGKGAHHRVG